MLKSSWLRPEAPPPPFFGKGFENHWLLASASAFYDKKKRRRRRWRLTVLFCIYTWGKGQNSPPYPSFFSWSSTMAPIKPGNRRRKKGRFIGIPRSPHTPAPPKRDENKFHGRKTSSCKIFFFGYLLSRGVNNVSLFPFFFPGKSSWGRGGKNCVREIFDAAKVQRSDSKMHFTNIRFEI